SPQAGNVPARRHGGHLEPSAIHIAASAAEFVPSTSITRSISPIGFESHPKHFTVLFTARMPTDAVAVLVTVRMPAVDLAVAVDAQIEFARDVRDRQLLVDEAHVWNAAGTHGETKFRDVEPLLTFDVRFGRNRPSLRAIRLTV